MTDPVRPLIRAKEAQTAFTTHSHPWNPDSEISGVQLGRMAGLERTGVSLARIEPGKESFIYHSHEREEEWLYILAGNGTAEIDGQEYQVGPGDFMGFPTPSVAHHLRNTGSEALVYLMGGENLQFEIATFPKVGKKMVRNGSNVEVYDTADAKPFGSLG